MDEKSQKITILLCEYSSWRGELQSKYTAQFQSFTILGIVLIGLITLGTNRGFSCAVIALIVGSFISFLFLLTWIDIDIARLSREVRRIEVDVNARAGVRWETQRALGGMLGRHVINWLRW
jgi:hypothetical protein